MTTTLPGAPRRAATAALAGLALLPLAACGGDETPGAASGGGLAAFAPAGSPFYAEGAVRPEGKLKSDLDALIEKFAPGQTADSLITRAFRDASGKVDFERDVKPWLGERAAVALTGLPAAQGGDPDGAAIIETTDGDKALATVRKSAEGTVDEREHAGVSYLFDSGEKSAAGLVEEKLVLGTEAGFKAVVDATKGKGLDTNPDYTKVADAVDEDALGIFYGDLRRVLDLAKSAPGTDATSLEGVRELFERRGLKTFAAGVAAGPKGLTTRAAAQMKDDGQGDAPARTAAALPAGSWAAAGLGDLGKSLTDTLDNIGSLSGAGFDVQSGLDQLKQQSGIDIQKDLLSWMGQSGFFVRGTSLTDIGGALVVESKDPAATKAALAKARTLVAGAGLSAQDLTGSGIDDGFSLTPAGAPVQVFAALAGKRFVLALNRAALNDAVDPARKLGDDAAYKAASEQLGDGTKPSFFLDFPKVSGLIGLAAAQEPGYAQAKPYLDKITTIASGSRRDGELALQTFVVGVR